MALVLALIQSRELGSTSAICPAPLVEHIVDRIVGNLVARRSNRHRDEADGHNGCKWHLHHRGPEARRVLDLRDHLARLSTLGNKQKESGYHRARRIYFAIGIGDFAIGHKTIPETRWAIGDMTERHATR